MTLPDPTGARDAVRFSALMPQHASMPTMQLGSFATRSMSVSFDPPT